MYSFNSPIPLPRMTYPQSTPITEAQQAIAPPSAAQRIGQYYQNAMMPGHNPMQMPQGNATPQQPNADPLTGVSRPSLGYTRPPSPTHPVSTPAPTTPSATDQSPLVNTNWYQSNNRMLPPTLQDHSMNYLAGSLNQGLLGGYMGGPSQMVNQMNDVFGQQAILNQRASQANKQGAAYQYNMKKNRKQRNKDRKQVDVFNQRLYEDRAADRDLKSNITSQILQSIGGLFGGAGAGGYGGGMGSFHNPATGQGAALPGYTLPSPPSGTSGSGGGSVSQPTQAQASPQTVSTAFGSNPEASQAATDVQNMNNANAAIDFHRRFTPQAAQLNLAGQQARSQEGLSLADLLTRRAADLTRNRNTRISQLTPLIGMLG